MRESAVRRALLALALFGCGRSVREVDGSPSHAGIGGAAGVGGSNAATGGNGARGGTAAGASGGGQGGHAAAGGSAGVGVGGGGRGGSGRGGSGRGGSGRGGSSGLGGAAGRGGSSNAGAAGLPDDAGAAGTGGQGDTEPCTLSVPGDAPTIQDAIDRAEAPAVVCIAPGIYGGGVVLRDGVSLRGTADSVFVCGDIEAHDLEQGVTLDGIGTGQSLRITTPARLTLTHFIRDGVVGCGVANYPAIPVTLDGGTLELDIDHASLAPDGIDLASPNGATQTQIHLSIRNSRCIAGQCYEFVHFGGALLDGSRLDVSLENNVLANVVLEGIGGGMTMTDSDLAASSLRIIHNTLFNPDELNDGIYLTTFTPGFLEVDNNAIASFRHPINLGTAAAGAHVGNNLTGFDTEPADHWYDAWFVDADHADFHPAPGSPLIGAGDDTLGGVLEDPDGASRAARSDVGAYQAE